MTLGTIAYLASQYPSPSQTFILNEISAMRRLGLTVVTFSVRSSEPVSEASQAEAARTFVLKVGLWKKLLGAVISTARRHRVHTFQLVPALVGQMREMRFRPKQFAYAVEALVMLPRLESAGVRSIHVHHGNNAADVAMYTVAFGNALRFSRECHEAWRWTLTVHGPTEFEAAHAFSLRKKLGSAAAVVCISDAGERRVRVIASAGAVSRVTVVHVGIDSGRFESIERLPHSRSPARLLFVGRLEPQKNPRMLVELVERLLAKGVEVVMKVAGDGSLRKELTGLVQQSSCASRIELVGRISEDDLPDLLTWADLLVLPSRDEGIPVVLMEAMAAGVPVVASDVGAVSELVIPGVTGTLSQSGSAGAFAAAVEEVLSNYDEARRMACGGRRKVKSEFDVMVSAKRQVQFFGWDSDGRSGC